jgi:RNA polymerase sigma-70 factor (ECF subfamily)
LRQIAALHRGFRFIRENGRMQRSNERGHQWMTQAAHDAVLAALARQGDVGAFEDLVRRHERRAFSLACLLVGDREWAEHVLQNALVTAFTRLGSLPERSDVGAWLLQAVAEACLDEVRRRSGRYSGPGEATGHGVMRDSLHASICRLADEERVVLVLFDVAGWSYTAIAAVVRCPVRTVQVRLHRARLALRMQLSA